MNNIDIISRESKLLVESAKDSVTNNVVNAARSGMISVSEQDLVKLVNLIEISTTEGYQKSLPFFQKSIKQYL